MPPSPVPDMPPAGTLNISITDEHAEAQWEMRYRTAFGMGLLFFVPASCSALFWCWPSHSKDHARGSIPDDSSPGGSEEGSSPAPVAGPSHSSSPKASRPGGLQRDPTSPHGGARALDMQEVDVQLKAVPLSRLSLASTVKVYKEQDGRSEPAPSRSATPPWAADSPASTVADDLFDTFDIAQGDDLH